ncbi:hypothetical protein VTJ04DRAFT_4704 [Mycothermus thermophilus]|uniref:uncharacterized protein n=1 Tax=Humicola insolens TaxID=85995 RepID=UPI003741F437
MENPVRDIEHIVHVLAQGTPDEQRTAIHRYYAPNASFMHPFCYVPPLKEHYVMWIGSLTSRDLIAAIFRWYKILSPSIDISVDSVAHDPETNTLYLTISQTFSNRFVPYHHAKVQLISVLHLTETTTIDDTASSSTPSNSAAADPNPYQFDAAHETLVAVQHGTEPSFAAIAAGNASAGGPGPITGNPNDDDGEPTTKRYVISAQSDFYTLADQARLVFPGSLASAVSALLQMYVTVLCGVLVGMYAALTGAVAEGKERLKAS